MKLAYQIFLLVFNILNITFHGVGIYALASIFKRSKHRPQRLYIISLSASEVFINFLEIFRNIPEILHHSGVVIPPSMSETVEALKVYTKIFIFTGVSCVYYFDMLLLTGDRLLSVILGLRYPTVWTDKKAKCLVYSTWCVGLGVCVAFSLAYGVGGSNSDKLIAAFYTYVYPTLELFFLLLAISTYSYIFCKRSESSNNLSTMSPRHMISNGPAGPQQPRSPTGLLLNEDQRPRKRSRRSLLKRSSRSFFLVPSLLIATFTIFMVIPDLTYLFLVIVQKKPAGTLEVICLISYSISHFTDACIYIFFLRDVRRFLLIKMRLRKDSVYLRQISTLSSTMRRRIRESHHHMTQLLAPVVPAEMTSWDKSFSAADGRRNGTVVTPLTPT